MLLLPWQSWTRTITKEPNTALREMNMTSNFVYHPTVYERTEKMEQNFFANVADLPPNIPTTNLTTKFRNAKHYTITIGHNCLAVDSMDTITS
jgi:hypothetical protein